MLLYHPITEGWWLGDDPAILRHILEYPLIQNLYAPEVWRSYSAANLTPLLILSLGLDHALFGLGAALGRAASAFGWNSAFALGFVGAVCALGVVAVLAAHRRSLGAFVVGTAVTVAPLVPVAALLDSRMLLLPAGLLVLLGIGGISWLARGPAGSGRGWPLLLILIWIGLNLWSLERSELWGQREWIERYRAEGRWVLEADPRLTLLEPIGPFWYYSGLAWIRENPFGRGTAPSVCFDACLCDSSELVHTRGYRDGDLIPVAARTDCPPGLRSRRLARRGVRSAPRRVPLVRGTGASR